MKFQSIVTTLLLFAISAVVHGETPSACKAPTATSACPHPVTTATQPTPQCAESKCKHCDGAKQALLKEKLAELAQLQKEVDELRKSTQTPAQVLVKLQVLEVNLTKLEAIDPDHQFLKDGKIVTEKASDISATAKNSPTASESTPAFYSSADKATTEGLTTFLKKNNIAKVLAEPQIVVLSGRSAQFQVGGEFPVPSADTKEIKFVDFGTKVDVMAEVLGNNNVRLHVRPRISQLDTAHTINVDGNKIPGVSVRQCDFSSETQFGKSIIVSGLVEQRTETCRTEGGVNETTQSIALAVIATPESVDPIDPEATPIPRLSKRGDGLFVPASAQPYDAPATPESPESTHRERR